MNVKEMRRLALIDLKNRRYIPDSMWEGEGNWVGIYARPVGTPKYGVDPDNEAEAQAMDGIDHAEWFEWYPEDLLELQKQYPQ
jgi:hypothetical protein